MKKIKGSKYKLSADEQKKCHGIIHTASVSSATVGAGLAQLPLADNAIITPIQITMIISLGAVFEQKITKTVAKSLLAGFLANIVGRSVAQAAWGWIPGIGNASNAITAAAITESIGWLCVDHFYKEKYLEKLLLSNNLENAEEKNKEETIKRDDSKRGDIKERAEEFFSGKKCQVENRDELIKLLDDLTDYLSSIDDKELYDIQERIMNLA